MAREKMYFSWEIPTSVVNMVNALCADYLRRERAILRGELPDNVLERYVLLNRTVDVALSEVEVGLRADLLQDIASGRGYVRSPLQCLVSKNTYYRRRRKLVHDIAKAFLLL